MQIRLFVAALIAVSAPAVIAAIQPAAAERAAPPMSAEATLAEKRLKALIKGATSGGKIDYVLMTPEVGKVVRDHPEGGKMIVKLGTPQSITYLGDPPGCHLFRLTYANAKIDFVLALNSEGKISSMYYHPAVDDPS